MEIKIDNFSTGYGKTEVLHHVCFGVVNPGIYVVLGKNGAGKTTLFRAMTGMLRAFSGSILFDGIPEDQSEVRIAYLSHKNSIPMGMTVKDAMNFFGHIEGVSQEMINNIISEFNLIDLLDRNVQSLSQGQKKRVSLAKSLIGSKEVIILDEPTANLDPQFSSEIREMILKLAKTSVVFYSSHNLYEATDIGMDVIALDGGNVVYTGDINGLSTGSYRIGIRGKGIEKLTDDYTMDGKYFVFDLKSPSDAAALISKLASSGAMIYEVKDLSNPLGRFFNDKA